MLAYDGVLLVGMVPSEKNTLIHVYLVPPARTTSHLENLHCSLRTLTSKSLKSEVLRSGTVFTISMCGVEGLGFRMQGLGLRFRIQLLKAGM